VIPTNTSLYTGAWRWTLPPNLLNEFRGGGTPVLAPFQTTYGTPSFIFPNNPANANVTGTLLGLGLTSPNDPFSPQGRWVTTRQYSDNATWIHGKHNVSFGVSYQGIDPHPYNFAATMPNITFGFSAANANNGYNLTAAKLPGASTATLNAMNAYAAFLSGTITTVTQTFQVQDLSSGFAPGVANQRAFHFSILSPY